MQTLNEKPDPRCLTDQGLFMVCDAGAYLKSTKDEVLGLQKQIDPDILKQAEAYTRALYDMMRGSIDASNRASVRDVVIPSIYGLQTLGGKLKKEQLATIAAYEQKLQEIAENRVKEQKRLVAMAQKLRD